MDCTDDSGREPSRTDTLDSEQLRRELKAVLKRIASDYTDDDPKKTVAGEALDKPDENCGDTAIRKDEEPDDDVHPTIRSDPGDSIAEEIGTCWE